MTHTESYRGSVLVGVGNMKVRPALASLLVLVVAAAATPAVSASGLRLIPLTMLSAIAAIGITTHLALTQRIYVNRSVLLLFSCLVISATTSVFGALDSGNGLPFAKLAILLYQYSFLLIAWIAAPYLSLQRLGKAVAIFAAGYGVLLVMQSAGVLPGADSATILGTPLRRARLFFSQPNGSAAYLAIALPLSALWRPQRLSERGFLALTRLLICVGLFATFSRSAMAAVVLMYFVVSSCTSARFGLAVRIIFAMAVIGAVLASLSLPIYELAELLTASDGALEGDYSAIERYGLGSAGIRMFYDNPIFGVGVGNYAKMLRAFDSSLNTDLNIPHNVVISFAAEQGIVGVGAFVLLVGILLRQLSKTRIPKPLNWAVWTLLINGWFGWPFIHGLGEPFMILTGLVLHHARCPAVESDDRSIDTIEGGTARATFGVAPHRS